MKYFLHFIFGVFFLNFGNLLSQEAFQNPIEKVEQITTQIISLLKNAEHQDYIGEPISQLEHALQCAKLAADYCGDKETIIAALLHDIGHLCANDSEKMGEYGVANHDIIGANYLRFCGMSEKICQLVLGHVQAKRYLTSVNPDYYVRLSEASKITLQMQGGPMSEEEAKSFEKDPLFHAKLLLRTWDEQAKVVGLEVPGLEAYRSLIMTHLLSRLNH